MKTKTKWVSLVLIAIFTFSTLAYSLVESLRFNPETGTVALPSTPVVTGSFSKEQETLAVEKGYTVVYLNYSANAYELKNYLEGFAYREKSQMFLIEKNSPVTEVSIRSMKGATTLQAPSVNETEDVLCNYLLKPPLECVLRQV